MKRRTLKEIIKIREVADTLQYDNMTVGEFRQKLIDTVGTDEAINKLIKKLASSDATINVSEAESLFNKLLNKDFSNLSAYIQSARGTNYQSVTIVNADNLSQRLIFYNNSSGRKPGFIMTSYSKQIATGNIDVLIPYRWNIDIVENYYNVVKPLIEKYLV